MKIKYNPYFLDTAYEQKTYNHIGKDYGDSKTADKGIILNITRWFRKQIYNKGEKFYKFCHTHADWIEHLKSRDVYIDDDNRQDYIGYLVRKERGAKISLEVTKVLIIPIYLALFSIIPTLEVVEKLTLLESVVLLCFVTAYATHILYKFSQELYFYQDYITYLKEADK